MRPEDPIAALVEGVVTRRISRRQFIVRAAQFGVSVSVIGAVLAACGEEPAQVPSSTTAGTTAGTEAAGPRRGGTVVLGYSSNVTNMDPPRVIGQWNNIPWYAAYDGLVRLKPGSASEFEPGLATSWDRSPDGRSITFELREGVRFHDGTDFNADAVVFNFQRIIDESHPHSTPDLAANRNNFAVVEDVRAIDPGTVEMLLEWPHPYIEQLLATYGGLIVSPSMIQERGEDSSQHEAGTGPFILDKRVEGDRLEFVRNDDYWAGQPYLDRLVIRTIPEASTQLAELLNGSVHIVEGITHPRNVSLIEENPDLQILESPGYMVTWLKFNMRQPIFEDVRVRQAVNLSIDRESLARDVFQGLVTPLSDWWPDISPFYDSSLDPWSYDPERARQLLADAGYPDGIEIDIWQGHIPLPHNVIGAELGTVIQDQLSRAGITVKLTQVEYGSFWATLREGTDDPEWDVLDGWLDGIRSIVADTDNFLFPTFRTFERGGFGNYGYYTNERVNDLIDEAGRTIDEDRRREVYADIQAILREDVAGAPLFQSKTLFTTSRKVQDFPVYPVVSAGQWERVWLSE